MDDGFYDDVFEALYDEAVPGLEALEEAGYTGDTPINYMQYVYGERQIEIIDEYCDEYDIPLSDRKQVKFNILLGKGPSTSSGNVERKLRSEGLENLAEQVLEEVE